MRAETSEIKKINNICLFQDDLDVKRKIRALTEEFGFPIVKRVLTLYFVNDIRLRCDVDNLYLGRRISSKTVVTWREAKFSSRYLGTLLNVLSGSALTEAAISNVIELTFPKKTDVQITYLSDTLLSEHQFEILFPETTTIKSEIVKEILKNKIDISQLEKKTSSVSSEALIDSLGVLNEKIIEFCKQSNLSLNVTPAMSYYHRISSVSNDYSELSDIFEIITDRKLTDSSPTPKIYNRGLPSASFIIPAYNLGNSIVRTLKSIDKQSPDGLNFEVIIVDDGSKEPIADEVQKIQTELSFQPIIIRKEKNSGISQTRNIGAAVSSKDILIFIDGDIVLTSNYLYEHLIRHKALSKAVLVSFKENVESDDRRISLENIEAGVEVPNYKSDLRITKYIDKDTMGYYANNYLGEGDIFSILTETNYFRTLGFGRRIGSFDLPSMVIGHNLSMTRKLFYSTGGFDNKISGYGLEDSLMGIKSIAEGAFIVPVLSCGVYHINHSTRRGSEEQIRKEFEENSKVIDDFLSQHE